MYPTPMPVYLTNNNQGSMIIPFSGEYMDTSESIYEFLEQISYLPSFNSLKIEQNNEKIADVKFGSEHEIGSFVHQFVNYFLNNEIKYRLRMAFNRRIQGHNEDAASYIKDKVYLYKKFNKINNDDESSLVADVVQNLNLTTQKNLRAAPSSLEDLKAQLSQADWIAREELRISLAPMMQSGFNMNAGYGIPNNSSVFDINNINTAQLHSLKQQWDLFQLQQNMNLLQVNNVANESRRPVKTNYGAPEASTRAKEVGQYNQNAANAQVGVDNDSLKVPRAYGAACGNCGDDSHTASGCRKPLNGEVEPPDVDMLSDEKWEAQKRARRALQLAKARERKKEIAMLDKEAVAQ
ncbi:hypothetical protein BD770DRAFT_449607, partial [Pilaira anomala]